MYMFRAYQSPCSGKHCALQCAHMPNFASRNHSGARYCFRDSHSGRNGPEAILRGRRSRFVSQLAAPVPFSAAMARRSFLGMTDVKSCLGTRGAALAALDWRRAEGDGRRALGTNSRPQSACQFISQTAVYRWTATPTAVNVAALAVALSHRRRCLTTELGVLVGQRRLSQTPIDLFEQTVHLEVDDDASLIGEGSCGFCITARLLIVLHTQVQLGSFVPGGPHFRNQIDGTV